MAEAHCLVLEFEVLLLVLFCLWVRNNVRGDNGFGVVTKSLKSKPVLFCSLALCFLNLVLMLLSGLYWYESGW